MFLRRPRPQPYDWSRPDPDLRSRWKGLVLAAVGLGTADGALDMLERIAGWLG